jgi:acyl-CoA thioester hydrolase
MPAIPSKPSDLVETARAVAFPWLCDSMGHLATQHYVAIFDVASYHFLGQIAPSVRALATQGRGWADVRHEIDYRGEVYAGELLTVRTRLVRRGRTSVKYQHEMTGDDGSVRAEMLVVTVHFDLKKRVTLPLPALTTAPRRVRRTPKLASK